MNTSIREDLWAMPHIYMFWSVAGFRPYRYGPGISTIARSILENEFRELFLKGQSSFVAKGLWYRDLLSYYCVCYIMLFFDLVVLLHNNLHFGYTSIEYCLGRSPMLSPTFAISDIL